MVHNLPPSTAGVGGVVAARGGVSVPVCGPVSVAVCHRALAASLLVHLRVDLRDGRRLSVPVGWFEWLARADDAQRADFEIIEDGQVIISTEVNGAPLDLRINGDGVQIDGKQ